MSIRCTVDDTTTTNNNRNNNSKMNNITLKHLIAFMVCHRYIRLYPIYYTFVLRL